MAICHYKRKKKYIYIYILSQQSTLTEKVPWIRGRNPEGPGTYRGDLPFRAVVFLTFCSDETEVRWQATGEQATVEQATGTGNRWTGNGWTGKRSNRQTVNGQSVHSNGAFPENFPCSISLGGSDELLIAKDNESMERTCHGSHDTKARYAHAMGARKRHSTWQTKL